MTDKSMVMQDIPEIPMPPKPKARPLAAGRRLTLQEQLAANKLKPMTDTKKKKILNQKEVVNPMNSILEQIRLRKEELNENGDIVKRHNGIEEDSDESDEGKLFNLEHTKIDYTYSSNANKSLIYEMANQSIV